MKWFHRRFTIDGTVEVLEKITTRLHTLIEIKAVEQNNLTNRLNECIDERQRAIRIQSNLESLLK